MLKSSFRSQDLLVYNFRLLLFWVGSFRTMFFEYSLKNFQGFMLLFNYQCPLRIVPFSRTTLIDVSHLLATTII